MNPVSVSSFYLYIMVKGTSILYILTDVKMYDKLLLKTKVRRKFPHKSNNSLETETDKLHIVIRRNTDSYYNLEIHKDDADIIQVISELLN